MWQSDRLLFFDDDDIADVPPPARREPRPNTLGAALFLLSIVVGLGTGLYFLIAWHVVRMH
jgi:hypothetical protein